MARILLHYVSAKHIHTMYDRRTADGARRSALLHLSLWMIQGPDCSARIKQFYPKCARNLTSFVFFLHVAFDKMPPRKEQPASFQPEAFELFVQFYDGYSLFVQSQRAYEPRQRTGFGHPFFLSSCVRFITRHWHLKKYLFLHFRDKA